MMNSEKVYKGKVIDVNLERALLPNGMEVDLEIIRHPGGASVLPLYDDGDVLLIRQFRHAAGGTIWEVPAGRIDDGEDPLSCAERELGEEAGVTAGSIKKLGEFFSTPGFCSEVIHLFLATDLVEGRQSLERDECIEVVRLPFQEAIAMVYSGEIIDSKTMLTLLLANKGFDNTSL